MNWQTEKLCTDDGHYELTVEKMKTDWHCEQKSTSWRWNVSYHGAVVAQGTAYDEELARKMAEKNVPAA